MGPNSPLSAWIYAVVVLISSACSSAPTPKSDSALSAPATPALNINVNTERLPFDTPQRMCVAHLVVDAVVSGWGATHWNTSDGARPSDLTALAVETQGYQIYRPLQLTKLQALVDHRTGPTIEFVSVGGSVGRDTLSEDYPLPTVGQRYLLVFVPGQRPFVPAPDYSTLTLVDAFNIDTVANVLFPTAGIAPNGFDLPGTIRSVPLSRFTEQLVRCPGAR